MKHDTAIAELARTKNPVAEQLRAAQELIRDPECLCRGAPGNLKTTFCSMAAVRVSGGSLPAEYFLQSAARSLGSSSFVQVSDTQPHATVMEMFDRAIKDAEASNE